MALLVETATMTVLLPDGTTSVVVTLTCASRDQQHPDGWAQWTADAPLPLEEIDGFRHLEITSLLANLSELITQALHPVLQEER
jgi:hypothetical protein